jgi:hypothetical protein
MKRTSLPLISHFDYSILFTVLAGVRASFGDENFSGEEKAGSVNDIGIRGAHSLRGKEEVTVNLELLPKPCRGSYWGLECSTGRLGIILLLDGGARSSWMLDLSSASLYIAAILR